MGVRVSDYGMTIIASVKVPDRYGSALLSAAGTALSADFDATQRQDFFKYCREEVARVLDSVANEAFKAGIAYQKKVGGEG